MRTRKFAFKIYWPLVLAYPIQIFFSDDDCVFGSFGVTEKNGIMEDKYIVKVRKFQNPMSFQTHERVDSSWKLAGSTTHDSSTTKVHYMVDNYFIDMTINVNGSIFL